MHKWSIDSRYLKWSVQTKLLLNNCKQNITSLSIFAGRTVMRICIVSPSKNFRCSHTQHAQSGDIANEKAQTFKPLA